MSIFYCVGCHQLRDSDEGCEEVRGELLCERCAADEYESAEAEAYLQHMAEQGARK